MTAKQIDKRRRKFLRKSPKTKGAALKLLCSFPRWSEEQAQNMAQEAMVLLYEEYRKRYYGSLYKYERLDESRTIIRAYCHAIETYAQRWIECKTNE